MTTLKRINGTWYAGGQPRESMEQALAGLAEADRKARPAAMRELYEIPRHIYFDTGRMFVRRV